MLKEFRSEGFDLASLECWTFDAAMAALGEEHKYQKEPADVRARSKLVVFLVSHPRFQDCYVQNSACGDGIPWLVW